MMSTLMDDANTRATLEDLRNNFFNALENGLDALVAFDHSWALFHETINSRAEKLQDDTLSMIYSFAELIATIVPGLLEVDISGERIQQQLQEDLVQIIEEGFYKLTLDGVEQSPDNHRPSSHLSYIRAAYLWLLENLHNPYPSAEIRSRIAREHLCSRKDVDAWFSDARRRIGWNSIRKNKISKTDLIAAATRFFKEGSSVSWDKDPRHSNDFLFVDMMVRAKTLYSSKNLEMASREARPLVKISSKRKRKVCAAALSYPSPAHSADGSPEQSDNSEAESEVSRIPERGLIECHASENTSLNIRHISEDQPSRKRKLSVDSTSSDQHRKQLKVHSDYECHQHSTSLPSPVPTQNDILAESTTRPSKADNASLRDPYKACSPSAKRKRRLSDVDSGNITKRLFTSRPQVQVDSDSPAILHSLKTEGLWSNDCLTYDFCSESVEPVRGISVDDREPLCLEYFAWDFSPVGGGIRLQSPSSSISSLDLEVFSNTFTDVDASAQSVGVGFVPYGSQLSDPSLGEILQGAELNLALDFFDSSDGVLSTHEEPQVKSRASFDPPSLLFDWTDFSQSDIEPFGFQRFTDSNYTSTTMNESEIIVSKDERIQQLRDELRRLEANFC